MIKPILDKATAAWAVIQNKHAQLQVGDTVNLKFQLFQSILVPTFHYGCEVWGMHSPTNTDAKQARTQLEQKYMFYLKRICGVQSTTSNAVILAETNMKSLKRFWWKQSIQFWNCLATASHTSLHQVVLLDNICDALIHHVPNFSQSVFDNLKSIGITLPTQTNSIPIIDIAQVVQNLDHQNSLVWNGLSANPRTAPSLNAKLCTYQNWFKLPSTANPYFLFPVSGKRMKRFLRFRVSSHSLAIEIGRRTRPQVPRSARLCPRCSSQAVGDEKHLVFECPFLQPVRFKYPSLFDLPLQSMHLFFSQKDRMHVFRFILDCLDMIDT